MDSARTDRLPHVDATLNYLAPMADRPRNYTFDPPPGVPRSNSERESRVVPVHDVHPIESDVSLDKEGFAVLHNRSAVQNFWDEDEVRRVYYPEVQRVMAEVTGASKVYIFDHTLRRRVRGSADRAPGMPRQPATGVHVDHTASSGPRRVRDFFGDEAERLLRGRVQVINLWRPIRCVTRRSRCATQARSLPPIWCRPIWCIRTASVRPTVSPTIRHIAGSMCRRCGRTRRCC
jgi:hypothetical protein